MSASFDSYRIFYYVGKYKNITHAASALFLSQSTVSRSMQSLENEVGCKLFERTQHGVEFTKEGNTLYEHIARACEQIFLGEEKLFEMQQRTQGGIRLGVSDFCFDHFVLPVMEKFHEEFPSVKFEVISTGHNYYDALLDSLRDGSVDIACALDSFPDKLGGSIQLSKLAEHPYIVIANSCFGELRYGEYSLSDLVSYPFASLVTDSMKLSRLDKLFLTHGLGISPAFKVDSMGMFLPLVEKCQCLAIVPSLIGKELTGNHSVFEVKMKEELPSHSICVLTSPSSPQSPAKDAFIRQLKAYIKRMTDFTSANN